MLALSVEAVHRELACLLAEASEFILLYSKLRGVDHDLVQIEPLQVFIVVSEKVGDNFLFVCILFSADDANVLDLTSRALERGDGAASLIPYCEHSVGTAVYVLLHAIGEEVLVTMWASNLHADGHPRKL